MSAKDIEAAQQRHDANRKELDRPEWWSDTALEAERNIRREANTTLDVLAVSPWIAGANFDMQVDNALRNIRSSIYREANRDEPPQG